MIRVVSGGTARAPVRKDGVARLLALAALACLSPVLSSCSDDCCDVDVAAVNQPPVALAASVTVSEDGSVGILLAGSDPDGTIAGYRVASQPTNGGLSGTAPDLTYTPDADFHGADEFTFTVTDDDGAESAAAAVTIEVTSVNDPPTALSQAVEVVGGESADIVLEGTDIDGSIVAYEITRQPAHGVLTGTAPDLTYAADVRYAGEDSFAFTVTDDEDAVSATAEVSIDVTAAPCRENRDLLAAFYWATGGDEWADNGGWLVADDLSDWHGVEAEAECVVAIRLQDNGLKGTLPWEIGSLEMLRHLDIRRGYCPEDGECLPNELDGGIPRELGNLTGLESLRLDGFGYITDATGALYELEGQGLTGPIPVELGKLSNLKVLMLGANKLSGPIPPELADLTHLESLFLNSNELSGEIPIELGNLANLTALSLKHNDLSGPIPPELGNLASLGHLALNANALSGMIPAELGQLTRLGNLWLDYNDLSGSIPAELGNLTSLRTLVLRSNELSGPLPVEIGGLASLRWLWLGANKLSGPIPVEVSGLVDLESLILAANELSGEIPVELSTLVSLERLDLGDNELSGAIPPELGALVSLTRLLLGGNALTGAVPAEVGNLTSAEVLELDRNQLSGPLPLEMTSLAELEIFRFDANAGLCAPTDEAFQAWLLGIPERDNGPNCE